MPRVETEFQKLSPGSRLWPLFAAIAFLALHRIPLALRRDFDPDELQHIHGGFAIAGGASPYVDYFEHHAPWFPVALSKLIETLGPKWETLLAARCLMVLVSLIGLLATWQLARRLTGSLGAASAALVQLTILSSTDKAIEIRPDVPAAVLFTFALSWAIDAFRERRAHRAFMSGVALGTAIVLTPKIAFGAIGLGLGALFFIGLQAGRRRTALGQLVRLVSASFLPVAATVIAVQASGHLAPFIRDVITGPLSWAREIDPWEHLLAAVKRNPFGLFAGLIGLGLLAARRPIGADPSRQILPCVAILIIAGWFMVPVPWPQFFMPLWPVLAVGAALFLEASALHTAARWGLGAAIAAVGSFALFSSAGSAWAVTALEPALFMVCAAIFTTLAWQGQVASGQRVVRALLAATAAAVFVTGALRVQPHALQYGALWVFMVAAVVLASRVERTQLIGLTILVAGPFTLTARLIERRPLHDFRAEFDAVMENTAAEESVLTGWRGCAVFRPHAYYYFFLHDGVLQMLSEADRGPAVLTALRSNPPGAAVRDAATRSLSEDVQSYLDEHYEWSGVGDVWLRVRD